MDQAKSDLSLQLGYKWVDTLVTEYFSKYQQSSMVGSFVGSVLKESIERGEVVYAKLESPPSRTWRTRDIRRHPPLCINTSR